MRTLTPKARDTLREVIDALRHADDGGGGGGGKAAVVAAK
jgi:hypothetical protein